MEKSLKGTWSYIIQLHFFIELIFLISEKVNLILKDSSSTA